MKLMRIADGEIVEIVELPDTVMRSVEQYDGSIVQQEVSATPEDFFSAEAGFVPFVAGADIGHILLTDGRYVAPVRPLPSPDDRRRAARAECARRIFARASQVTQTNIALHVGIIGAIAPSSRTSEQRADIAAARDCAEWVALMRARWPVIAAEGIDPARDDVWPDPSTEAMALAARF